MSAGYVLLVNILYLGFFLCVSVWQVMENPGTIVPALDNLLIESNQKKNTVNLQMSKL